jgi:hypothetical protein
MSQVLYLDSFMNPTPQHNAKFVRTVDQGGTAVESKRIRCSGRMFASGGYVVYGRQTSDETVFTVIDIFYLDAKNAMQSVATNIRDAKNKDITTMANDMLVKMRSSMRNQCLAFGLLFIAMCWAGVDWVRLIKHSAATLVNLAAFLSWHYVKRTCVLLTRFITKGHGCVRFKWETETVTLMICLFFQINVVVHVIARGWFALSGYYPTVDYWAWFCMGSATLLWDVIVVFIY